MKGSSVLEPVAFALGSYPRAKTECLPVSLLRASIEASEAGGLNIINGLSLAVEEV